MPCHPMLYSLVALIPIATVFISAGDHPAVRRKRPCPVAYLVTAGIALLVWQVPFV
jgi:L-lactate permease